MEAAIIHDFADIVEFDFYFFSYLLQLILYIDFLYVFWYEFIKSFRIPYMLQLIRSRRQIPQNRESE